MILLKIALLKLTKIVNVIKIKLTIDEIKQKMDGIKAIINGDGF